MYSTVQYRTLAYAIPRVARLTLSVYYFTETDGDLKARIEAVHKRRVGKHARGVSVSSAARELILERLDELEAEPSLAPHTSPADRDSER